MATTFQNIYQDVRNRLQLQTDDDTIIKGYINDRYKELAAKHDWIWLREKRTLTTIAKYNTGTVTVTEGSATVAGSGTAFTSTMIGRKFQADNWDEIYTISACNSSTEITLDNEFNGESDSDVNYSIFQDLVSLPSDLNSIVVLRQHATPIKLILIGIRELLRLCPSPSIEDIDPIYYAYYEPDSNGYQQIMLRPAPYRQIVLDLEYIKTITELSGDTDVSLIPEQYRQILKIGAMADIYAQRLDDNRFQIMEARFNNMYKDMLNKYLSVDDHVRLIPDIRRETNLNLQSLADKYDMGDYFDRW